MSFQDCETWDDFLTAERNLRQRFVAGISGYADIREDGAESLAEAFVRVLNGEKIPDNAKMMVDDHTIRWRK